MTDNRTRILAVYTLFDEGRELTVPEIIQKLKDDYEIGVERKTIYTDIAKIKRFLPIVKTSKNTYKADFSLWRYSDKKES